jgi:UDP-4-amino-4-deoxy-L-arabinose formyltransferase/UDP-glucuronic acid dehydrogenase (UDP-4-keto-hexauronic acid decarboxylating)
MKIAIIGRSEVLYETTLLLHYTGHKIVCILTSKEAPEYTRTAADFLELANKLKVPFERGGEGAEYTDLFKKSKADIAVSINYTGVLPQSIIDQFPHGVLNAHGGDLPRYRGNACQAWAILNGEQRIGLCIHKMIGGELDSGDIIARDYLSIDHSTKITMVWEWMMLRTPQLMLEALQLLDADSEYVLEKQSKDLAQVLRCYPRKPEDGRIDWNQSAIKIIRLINACNKPYAGAFCEFEDEKLIIWDAELVSDGEVFFAVPGQVTKIGDGFIEIACKDGKIAILTCEINGVIYKPSTLIRSVRKRLN